MLYTELPVLSNCLLVLSICSYQQRTYVTFCSFSHSELTATIGMIFLRYPTKSKNSSSTYSSSMEA